MSTSLYLIAASPYSLLCVIYRIAVQISRDGLYCEGYFLVTTLLFMIRIEAPRSCLLYIRRKTLTVLRYVCIRGEIDGRWPRSSGCPVDSRPVYGDHGAAWRSFSWWRRSGWRRRQLQRQASGITKDLRPAGSRFMTRRNLSMLLVGSNQRRHPAPDGRLQRRKPSRRCAILSLSLSPTLSLYGWRLLRGRNSQRGGSDDRVWRM